ncbi:MAG: 50S ribosomal protein L25, partial [Chloroflexota bacterium]
MAEKYVIEAQTREIVGKKVSQLRRQGIVPVTVYGPKSQPVNLQVPYRPLQLALMKAGGTNLIEINVDGKPVPVLAREVQRDIIRNDIMHVDFFAVDMTAKIRIDVPLHFIGDSSAVATKKGILVTGPTTITIETLPSHLLNQIEIDISNLNEVNDAIHVRDLNLGEEIVIINDPEEMIARISQPAAARSEED